jgi:hypothetical protein
MKIRSRLLSSILTSFAISLFSLNPVHAAPDAASDAKASALAKTIVAELASFCPIADPNSTAAYDSCRLALFRDSSLKRTLPEFILWGRQKDPKKLHKESNLTQFNPDIFTSMYLSLFMFNGKYTVAYDPRENNYLIRLQTAFRNRLAPGEYPYPFWHEDDKWSMYEKANEVLLWWDADKNRFKVAQFTVFGSTAPIADVKHMDRSKFDGQWLWTDTNGVTQPKVTLFDGIYKADNPYISKIDSAYKGLALTMRDAQCNNCHVPNNPNGMKKLVLLQTPMHAAAEIKRVIKSLNANTMPVDEFGLEESLNSVVRTALLDKAIIFDKLVDEAKLWESSRVVGSSKR